MVLYMLLFAWSTSLDDGSMLLCFTALSDIYCIYSFQNISSNSEMMLQPQLPNVPQVQLAKMATHLEIRLWRSSPTLGDYCNTRTLQQRLQTALKSMKSRLQNKQKRISKSKVRSIALEESFHGDTMLFTKVKSLVDVIKKEKNELVGSSCSECQPVVSGPGFQVFRSKDTNTLPEALQKLFFQTPLVDAFDKYSPQRLTGIDWQTLLETAQKNLSIYYEWKAANYVCYKSS